VDRGRGFARADGVTLYAQAARRGVATGAAIDLSKCTIAAVRLPQAPGLGRVLRLAWCLAGAACGLAAALAVSGPQRSPLLLASLGGSTVFLFGLTRAPAAQPRALVGGHVAGAAIGIACYGWLGDTLSAYALATALTLAFMLLARAVHPPAGANPILMIHAHAAWGQLWQPVLLGVGMLMAVAVVWSRLYPGLARYPLAWATPSPERFDWGGWADAPAAQAPPRNDSSAAASASG
jgi:CBS-domain-containing membrane protein